jgi:hypothetical protein
MPSLHTATETTKNIFKWGAIGVAGIIGLIVLFNVGRTVFLMVFPPKPPPPTVEYGALPPIPFPDKRDETLVYTIDTVDGQLPVLPDRLPVYPLLKYKPTLNDADDARARATNIGFTNGEVALSEQELQWGSSKGLPRTLTMDIVNRHFTISSSYLTTESIINPPKVPTTADAINSVETFIGSIGLKPSDYDSKKTRTETLTIQDATLIPSESLSDTRVIRVNLYQKDVEFEMLAKKYKLPIYYENPPYSPMDFLIAGGTETQDQIVQANFFYQLPDYESSSTYPIKTAAEAFEELKNGNAYIATNFSSSADIPIKQILFGYYLASSEQQYLMPVIVFKGYENEFFAFVSAVREEQINKE